MNPKAFSDEGLKNVIEAATKELKNRAVEQEAETASDKLSITIIELTKIRDELRRKPRIVVQYKNAEELRSAIWSLEDAVHKFWDAVHEAEKVRD